MLNVVLIWTHCLDWGLFLLPNSIPFLTWEDISFTHHPLFDMGRFVIYSLVTSQHSTTAFSGIASAAVTMRRRVKADTIERPPAGGVVDIVHKNYFNSNLTLTNCWSSEQRLVKHESSLTTKCLPEYCWKLFFVNMRLENVFLGNTFD